MTTLDELEKLLKAGTPGPWRTMAGDPLAVDAHEAVYVCKMTGATPVTRLAANAALIVAAINALPGLIESAKRVERLEAALVVMSEAADQFGDWDDDDKKLFVALRLRDLRRARAALKGT